MTEQPSPPRLAILWSLDARADLRAIDRNFALDILHCIDRFLTSRSGDVKKLKAPLTGYRLRCGDHRIFFIQAGEAAISITRVKNRREAYR